METNDVIKIATAVASVGAILISAASIIMNNRNNCVPMNGYSNMIQPYGNPYGNPYVNNQYPIFNPIQSVPQPTVYPQTPVITTPYQTPTVNNFSNRELTWQQDPTNISRRCFDNNIYNVQNSSYMNNCCPNYGYGYNDLSNPNMFGGLSNQFQIPFNCMNVNPWMYNHQQNSYNSYPYRYDYNTSFGFEKYYMTDPYGRQRQYCSKELMNCGYKDSMWMSAPEKETCEYDWSETTYPPISMTRYDKPPDDDNGVVPLFGPPDWVKSDKFKAV